MTAKSRLAIYPGSFDPITRGHEEIVRRALRIADRLIVAVAHQPSRSKQGMFSVDERLDMIGEVFADEPAVEAAEFDGLLVEFARQRGASIVVRGLRSVSDFEYEVQMALTNRQLDPAIETVFLAPDGRWSFLSASLVREIARLGGDASAFVSEPVQRRLRERSGSR
ncbi:MAG: pantetheine-phosphate adenylyltransferase [Gemmatimonadota bacterium]